MARVVGVAGVGTGDTGVDAMMGVGRGAVVVGMELRMGGMGVAIGAGLIIHSTEAGVGWERMGVGIGFAMGIALGATVAIGICCAGTDGATTGGASIESTRDGMTPSSLAKLV